MNQYLFDTSAIILLTKNYPSKAPILLDGGFLLDLTIYEVGNVIWKVNKLIDKSGISSALNAFTQIFYLISVMDTVRVEGLDEFNSVMEIAFNYDLTFYDTSYLHVAQKMGIPLVTEDNRLFKRASEAGIKCFNVKELVDE